MTLAKFEYMFAANKTQAEVLATIKPLLEQFQKYNVLDGKPEKGERKVADEMVLHIATIIEDHLNNSPEPMALLDVFKIILLEEAYSKSPYNFDIQL